MQFVKNFPKSILLSIVGIVIALVYLFNANQPDTPYVYAQTPSSKPDTADIVATGAIEAGGGNVVVQPFWPGRVQTVLVHEGQSVKAGAPLYTLSDAILKTKYMQAQAMLEAKHQAWLDLENGSVKPEGFAYKLEQAYQDYQAAKATAREAQLTLAQATIRAPLAGVILQVNVRPGEWAGVDLHQNPVVMGDLHQLQVRADVDEDDASQIHDGMPATAVLRGDTSKSIPLTFSRIEPMMLPKRNLSGNDDEQIDVRVLQVLYSFKPPVFPVYPGEQLDVFIQK